MSGSFKVFLSIVIAVLVTPFVLATVFWMPMFSWLLDVVCKDAFCRIGGMLMTALVIPCVVATLVFWLFGRLTVGRDEQKSLSESEKRK
jgi:dolichyl-phosphate-mannose--protein O-mannosyl transferase